MSNTTHSKVDRDLLHDNRILQDKLIQIQDQHEKSLAAKYAKFEQIQQRLKEIHAKKSLDKPLDDEWKLSDSMKDLELEIKKIVDPDFVKTRVFSIKKAYLFQNDEDARADFKRKFPFLKFNNQYNDEDDAEKKFRFIYHITSENYWTYKEYRLCISYFSLESLGQLESSSQMELLDKYLRTYAQLRNLLHRNYEEIEREVSKKKFIDSN